MTRVAVVSGGAEGIGLAIVRRLVADGARVVLADSATDKGRAAADAFGAMFIPLDVTSEEMWDDLAARVARDLGGLDLLVNNAGVNPGPCPMEDTSLSAWRSVMAVNLDGAFLGCRTAVRAMVSGGSIVNIGSAAGVRAVGDMPAYAASKAGLHALTRSVALYCGRKGLRIRCNAVLPGSVETPMVERLRAASGDADAARARAASLHPIGFVGAPEDIAGAVAWLAGPEARFVTGALLSVDGGLTL